MERTPLEAWIFRKITGRGLGGAPLQRKVIAAYQLRQLQETIDLVMHKSRFYRQLYSGLNTNLSGLADLTRLPFTTPEDVRNVPLDFLCVSQSDINRVVTLQSSGTTGQPKRLFFTQADQELTIDFFQHGMSTLVKPGERVMILLPGERPGSVGDLLKTGLTGLGVSAIVHGPVRDAAQTLAVMVGERVDAVVGIPTQVLALARYRDAAGKPAAVAVKNVLLSTDYVPDAIVAELQSAWDCRVYNHYGMTEMGLGGGVECQDLSGYHLREADLYFEIVNPDTGLPAAEGELGEVVFTTLTRQGMPLIRYRTGDLSRFIPEPCPCGSVLKRMDRVKQRVNGYVQLGQGLPLSMAELDEALFKLNGLLNFAATLTGTREKACLQLEVQVRGSKGDYQAGWVEQALGKVPAVSTALADGKLQLQVNISGKAVHVTNGTAKRMIADHRSKGGGQFAATANI